MEYIEFPKWKYRKDEAVLVDDAATEKALGKGWGDAPDSPAAEPSE